MGKASKNKNGKIPKLTEAEYAAYVSSLRESEETPPLKENKIVAPAQDCAKTEMNR